VKHEVPSFKQTRRGRPFVSKRDRQQQLEQRIETEETTILFVGDENIVIDVVQEMLEELGYRVLTAKGEKTVWGMPKFKG
jgi:PleD family two-component response regulator